MSKWNELDNDTKLITNLEEFTDKVINKVNSNPLYYYGSRKANIIHSQLRTHCSDLKAHLVELHVSYDPMCVVHIIMKTVNIPFLTVHCIILIDLN